MIHADPEPIKVATSADVQAIASLLKQLSSSAPPFSRADLEAMLADPATTIFAIRAGDRIVGTTSLVVFRVATGVRAFIDDVVVIETHRTAWAKPWCAPQSITLLLSAFERLI